MNKYLTYTAALIMPVMVSAQALAQTTTTSPPPAPMAHAAGSPTAPVATPSTMGASSGTTKLSAADKRFITKAAQGGTAEVQMAQLAQQKGQSDEVKTFAQKMIDDHTPNNAKLTQLATSKNDTPPSEVDAAQQKMMDKLQGLEGKKFDAAYLKGQVTAHKAMLKVFQEESKNGTDADLKAFADETIPTIQSHITMAQGGKSAM